MSDKNQKMIRENETNDSESIDFVITWVDGSDPAWRKQKAEYSGTSLDDDSEERYREWDLLRYWFRGVEKFAPWVRKIHFVTWGHLPGWLDTSNPKLHIVRHEDYIPKEYLPTFNSTVIELFFHKIEGLSEHFVYFNDDMFLIRSIRPELFFRKGLPCDMLALQPVVANPANPVMSCHYLNHSLLLCKYFDKRSNMKKQPGAYFKVGYPPLYFCYNFLEMAFPLFTGFYTAHDPSPFRKSTFEELWEKEGELFRTTAGNRFRGKSDLSQYVFREWQKLSGSFIPVNVHSFFQYFSISQDNKKLCQFISRQKNSVICINDTYHGNQYEQVKKELKDAFEKILPEVSSFER